MEISNIRVRIDDWGYPALLASIGERSATIPFEQKALEHGFLFVGADFEEILPVLYLPADGIGRPEPEPIYGFIDDQTLLAAYQIMVRRDREGTLREGPLET